MPTRSYAIIVPVYNEQALFRSAFDRLVDTEPVTDPVTGEALARTIIIVDDGSTDGTDERIAEIADREDVASERHEKNMGKGSAVRTGLARARELGVDVALIHDADMEYDPRDHGPLLEPILDGRADSVIGSRFIGGTHRVLYYWHSVANRSITWLSNCLTNLNLSDIECCLKAFDRGVLEGLDLREPRFGIEPEIIARLAKMRITEEGGRRRRLRIYEIPVSYSGRTYDEGKKIGWRDGVSALRCILRYNLLR